MQFYEGSQRHLLSLEGVLYDLDKVCCLVFGALISSEASLLWGDDTLRVQVPLQALIDNALYGLADAACQADGAVAQDLGFVLPFFSEPESSWLPSSTAVPVLLSS